MLENAMFTRVAAASSEMLTSRSQVIRRVIGSSRFATVGASDGAVAVMSVHFHRDVALLVENRDRAGADVDRAFRFLDQRGSFDLLAHRQRRPVDDLGGPPTGVPAGEDRPGFGGRRGTVRLN